MQERTRGLLMMTAGVLMISPDSLLVRLATGSGSLHALLFWRLVFTAITQFAISTAVLGGVDGVKKHVRSAGIYFWASVPLQATGNVCIVMAFALTSAANALVLFYLQPIWASMGAVLYFKDPLPRRTVLASFIGLCAAVAVFAGTAAGDKDSRDSPAGDVLALVAGVTLAGYFMVCRACAVARPEADMLPAAAAGQALAAVASIPVGYGGITETSSDMFWLWVVINSCVVMSVPILLMTVAMRHITAPENALIGLLELAFGPVWVFWALGEAPSVWTLVGGVVLLCTLAWHEWTGLQELRRKADTDAATARGVGLGAASSPNDDDDGGSGDDDAMLLVGDDGDLDAGGSAEVDVDSAFQAESAA